MLRTRKIVLSSDATRAEKQDIAVPLTIRRSWNHIPSSTKDLTCRKIVSLRKDDLSLFYNIALLFAMQDSCINEFCTKETNLDMYKIFFIL